MVFDLISHLSPDDMVRVDVMLYSPSIHCLRARSRLRLIPSSLHPYLISTFLLGVLENDVLLMLCLLVRLSSATKWMRGLILSSFEGIVPFGTVLLFDLISLGGLDEMVRLDLMLYSPSIRCLRTRSRLRLIPSSLHPYLISTVFLGA